MTVCTARSSRTGQPCRQYAIRGGRVCVAHGGLAPQVIAKAEDRLRALVQPAISGLAELINKADSDSVRLSAIRDLLDRTGYKPTEKVQSEGRQVIEIEYVDRPNALELPPSNGTAH